MRRFMYKRLVHVLGALPLDAFYVSAKSRCAREECLLLLRHLHFTTQFYPFLLRYRIEIKSPIDIISQFTSLV